VVSFRYDWDDDVRSVNERPTIRFRRIDANHIPHELRLGGDAQLVPRAGSLLQLPLLDLRDPQRTTPLIPGESLEVTLTFRRGSAERVEEEAVVTVALAIVAAPVIPAPEAGYALLRRQVGAAREEVECVRFAWSPTPARIELVSPADLRTGVVRRRAVFHWRDTVRVKSEAKHAIQKLTLSGSTQIPTVG
jgi:hypothetical protein